MSPFFFNDSMSRNMVRLVTPSLSAICVVVMLVCSFINYQVDNGMLPIGDIGDILLFVTDNILFHS